MRVLYLVSHYPSLTETFVYRELLRLWERGRRIEIGPLHRPDPAPGEGELAELSRIPVRYVGFGNALVALAKTAIRNPIRFAELVWEMVRTCWFRPGLLLRAGFCLIRAAGFARQFSDRTELLVHVHFCHLEAVCAYFLHRLTGIPFVLTNHVIVFRFPRRFCRSILKSARFVICDFQWNRDWHLEEFDLSPDRVILVRGGLLIPPDPPQVRPRSEVPRILNIGRLRPTKGQADLVRACARLKERGISFRCDIIGEGDQRVPLERLIRELGVQDSVRLPGSCSWKELGIHYKRADLFVFPGIHGRDGISDGVPTVLLEAALCGIPIITTSLPGPGELVDDGWSGLVVPEADPDRLAAAIESLLATPAHGAEMARRGWERLRKRFDIRRNSELLERVLVRAVGAGERNEENVAPVLSRGG